MIDRADLLMRAIRPASRSTALVRQRTATECGAACLAMVLRRFGSEVPLDRIREAVTGARDGATAFDLLDGARAFGLRGRGIRLDDVDDLRSLAPPCILHWEMRHFVVFDGWDRRGVRVLDPAIGRRHVAWDDLGRAFTGIVLLLEPDESFRPVAAEPSRAWPLLRSVLARSGRWGRIAVTSALLQGVGLGAPVLTGLVVDRVVPRQDLHLLTIVGLGLAALVGYQVLAGLVRTHLLLELRTVADSRLTATFVGHLMRLPYDFFQRRSAGDLLTRLNANATLRELSTSGLLSGVLDGLTVLAYLAILLAASPSLAALAVAISLAQAAVLAATWPRQRELVARMLAAQARVSTQQVEMLTGVETLKAMGAEERAIEVWHHRFVEVLNLTIERGHLDAASGAALGALRLGGPMLLLWVGAWWVVQGWSTLGTMLALCALAGSFGGAFDRLVATAAQLQVFGTHLDQLDDVLRAEPEQPAEGAAPVLTGRIDVEGVCFAYGPRSAAVLRDVSLSIGSGELVALVGRSGSGKSTLARILVGLYRPRSGRVLFDGRDLSELDLGGVRRQIGVVTQDPHLFGGSIRDNIALADPELPLDEVEAAARAACLHEDVLAMPMGYDTVLTDGGRSLSGGQRQRLALARALARRPRLLLLDEATSALDAVTEARIQQELERIDCTRIVVAHRLSTVRRADRIVVLEAGEIVEVGSHDELVAAGGAYARLLGAQL